MYKITVESSFSAAHHLSNYSGNCENIHGHNWKVRVTACYEDVDSCGMGIDFRELKRITEEVLGSMDHRDLNNEEYFIENNPTSENIARYIFDRVKDAGIPVGEVTVFETDRYSATYTGK